MLRIKFTKTILNNILRYLSDVVGGGVILMNAYYVAGIPYSDELFHFGIKGQRWGIRRYQNPDGTLTAAGKARYGTDVERMAAKDAQRYSDAKAAYGEGAGVRRRLLDKELGQKMKAKEYKKAYEEASQHVDVGKSLKRAEKLHKHSGTFVRGRELSDRGKTVSKAVLDSAKNLALTALFTGASYAYSIKTGDRTWAKLAPIIGGVSAATTIGKGARDVYSISYYERNKKF